MAAVDMSNWFYLAGSVCFAVGTLLAMIGGSR